MRRVAKQVQEETEEEEEDEDEARDNLLPSFHSFEFLSSLLHSYAHGTPTLHSSCCTRVLPLYALKG